MKTVVKNIGLLATPLGNKARRGKEQGRISLVPNTYIVACDGYIAAVGGSNATFAGAVDDATRIIDAQGALVTPGLVDCHTHLVFSGWRQRELPLKLQGLSYLDILRQGGGILYTVNRTRQATLAQLMESGRRSLDIMLAHGTTTCEVKSGYGLNLEDEIKSLRAIGELNKIHPLDLVPTFMGAHAIPNEYRHRKSDYVKLICEAMIPAVAGQNLAEFCDVFCEDGVFTVDESRAILECGARHGLLPKIHADEITASGGAGLAGELQAVSAEHLIHADDKGLVMMAQNGTIAVLLPGTSFYLGESFARAGKMIELNLPVAVATDFNPGSCPTESLQLPMNIACLKYRLTPAEVLTAVTLNAAAAIHRADAIGSIEPGKQADLVIWNAADLEYIFYHWGINLVRSVVKRGKPVSLAKI
ncbi:MAG TPA: imidazolonepropionase [Methylomusa anaerophila]|uniref:Imidazolonepropionase n=1 Tax=Methylomusa anaerophila TaxID=1930071 RepID=A0A348AJ82_9FIRM|nr:imidazolonepropionase [Methylomusa anaerophila]BBB91130.1 imidazolonepropionase [Methylomusa anaerophila]HML89006.1 imidazolonepropionase [Methylomusa anaerophila]